VIFGGCGVFVNFQMAFQDYWVQAVVNMGAGKDKPLTPIWGYPCAQAGSRPFSLVRLFVCNCMARDLCCTIHGAQEEKYVWFLLGIIDILPFLLTGEITVGSIP